MKLQSLLTLKLNYHSKKAFIISNYNNKYQAQSVIYHPEILNLGVILLGYYTNIRKSHQLLSLGNLLSVGHYLQSPTILKYGKNFKVNPCFQNLFTKNKQHLISALQDGTIAFSRDLQHPTTLIQSSNFHDLINKLPSQNYYYYYTHNKWMVINNHTILSLAKVINNQLRKRIINK